MKMNNLLLALFFVAIGNAAIFCGDFSDLIDEVKDYHEVFKNNNEKGGYEAYEIIIDGKSYFAAKYKNGTYFSEIEDEFEEVSDSYTPQEDYEYLKDRYEKQEKYKAEKKNS